MIPVQKFSNRLSTREKHDEFSHNAFDAAFQIECISSEESGEDEDAREEDRRKTNVDDSNATGD